VSAPSLDEAQRFFDQLAPDGRITFQTFDESGRHRLHLSRVLHGSLAEHDKTLADLNSQGAGIYWMVNAGDGKGRKAPNVQRVRALFVDLDGAPLEPVLASPLAPHCIVETSPGKWHAYWRTSDCPPPEFTAFQKALAAHFKGDAKVCDLPRVMRIPGFDHRKGNPFRSHIVNLRQGAPYSVAELTRGLGLRQQAETPPQPRRALPDAIDQGERNATLLSLAAGLVRKGHDAQAVNNRLQRINAERCQPPLGADEVDSIVNRAVGYGSDGHMQITHGLWDSMKSRMLPLPVRMIVLTALRRFDGSNNGRIALTWQDCKDIPGCRDENRFLQYRAQTVASGFLILAHESKLTRDGKTPSLYAIPSQYLPSLTEQNTRLALPPQNTRSYIDKQVGANIARNIPGPNSKTGEAA